MQTILLKLETIFKFSSTKISNCLMNEYDQKVTQKLFMLFGKGI